MQKKLSILIPVYNMQQYLDDCLQSLVKQKWQSVVEIVIIDDGSTDNSGKICAEYADKYSYISLYSKDNGGVSSARNEALEYATGEYLYWVDPDDFIADNFWEIIEPILLNGYDFVFFDMHTIIDNKRSKHMFEQTSRELSINELINYLADGVRIFSHLPTKIIKKTLWEGVQFPKDIAMCEDYSVLTYIAPKAKSVYYLHEALYNYRQHIYSITHNLSVHDMEIIYNLAKTRYAYFRQAGYAVTSAGIRYVEYLYLKYIVSGTCLKEDSVCYEHLFYEMLKNLKQNKNVLLESGLLDHKSRLLCYLLLWDMRILINLIVGIKKFLKL